MLPLWLILLLLTDSRCLEYHIATYTFSTHRIAPTPLVDMQHVAHFGDAENRGPTWYDFSSDDSNSNTELDSKFSETESSISSDSDTPSSNSITREASSIETSDEKLVKRVYRSCTPCAHDMLKKFSNIGIKWICGGYQRARRSFKSECMMRYRNCEDGTMFTKISEHRCKNDTYHGRHWFYEYRV